MKKMALLVVIVAFCFNPEVQGQDWSAFKDFELAKLEGEWSVVSVDVDGDFSKAQIGQRPGDSITLSGDVNVGLPLIG